MFDINYDDNYATVLNCIIDHNNYSGTGDSGGASNVVIMVVMEEIMLVVMMKMIPAELMMKMTMMILVMKSKMKFVIMMRLNRFGYKSLIVKNNCYASPMLYTYIMLPTCIRNLVWFHITQE